MGPQRRVGPEIERGQAANLSALRLAPQALRLYQDEVNMYTQAVEEVSLFIEPILYEMEIELVDVEYLSEGGRWVLRIYVDRDGGVTLDDCVRVSREIEDLIEVKDLFRQPYVLEVSSPGLNRRLKKEKDFVRAVGNTVAIRLAAPLDGRRNFKGTLESFVDGVLCVAVNNDRFFLPYGEVEHANLIYDFGD